VDARGEFGAVVEEHLYDVFLQQLQRIIESNLTTGVYKIGVGAVIEKPTNGYDQFWPLHRLASSCIVHGKHQDGSTVSISDVYIPPGVLDDFDQAGVALFAPRCYKSFLELNWGRVHLIIVVVHHHSVLRSTERTVILTDGGVERPVTRIMHIRRQERLYGLNGKNVFLRAGHERLMGAKNDRGLAAEGRPCRPVRTLGELLRQCAEGVTLLKSASMMVFIIKRTTALKIANAKDKTHAMASNITPMSTAIITRPPNDRSR